MKTRYLSLVITAIIFSMMMIIPFDIAQTAEDGIYNCGEGCTRATCH